MYVSKCNWKSTKPIPVCVQKRYRALYDYAAADEDEVSFADGDLIVDVQQIDEGWMFGRVERTGQQGMLPANYVEAIWVSVAERRRRMQEEGMYIGTTLVPSPFYLFSFPFNFTIGLTWS